jgi:hypothetical protein
LNYRAYVLYQTHTSIKLYAVITSQQAVLLEVKEDGTESEVKCQLFHSNPSTQINVHVLNNSCICVLAWKHGIKVKKSRHFAKFVMYDVRNQRRMEHSKGLFHQTHKNWYHQKY